MNKKAQQTGLHKLIILILVVLVVILVIYVLYKIGMIEYFKNLLPEFGKKGDTEKIIAEQAAVPAEEKAIEYTSEAKKASRYPVVRLYYTQGPAIVEDSFAFRWNRKESRVQVLMNIRAWTDWKGKESKVWLIHADLSNEFEKQKGISYYTKEDVTGIMGTNSEEEMTKKIAKASERRNVDVDFPISGQETSEGFARGHSEVTSEKEMKHKLMQYYPEFYKEEIKEAIEKGEEFTSDEMKIYFKDGGYDDLVIVRWNFAKQKPEIILRPDKDKILEKGQEVWLDDKDGVRAFLQQHNRPNDIKNTNNNPYLTLIEGLLTLKKPTQLSEKIRLVLNREEIYTVNEKTKATDEKPDLRDINGRMYGYENENPDELFKLENEE